MSTYSSSFRTGNNHTVGVVNILSQYLTVQMKSVSVLCFWGKYFVRTLKKKSEYFSQSLWDGLEFCSLHKQILYSNMRIWVWRQDGTVEGHLLSSKHRSHNKMVGGVQLWSNQIPSVPTGWVIHKLENNYITEFSHRDENSKQASICPSEPTLSII